MLHAFPSHIHTQDALATNQNKHRKQALLSTFILHERSCYRSVQQQNIDHTVWADDSSSRGRRTTLPFTLLVQQADGYQWVLLLQENGCCIHRIRMNSGDVSTFMPGKLCVKSQDETPPRLVAGSREDIEQCCRCCPVCLESALLLRLLQQQLKLHAENKNTSYRINPCKCVILCFVVDFPIVSFFLLQLQCWIIFYQFSNASGK